MFHYGWLLNFQVFKNGCENHGNYIQMSKIQGQNEIRKCLLLCQGENTFFILNFERIIKTSKHHSSENCKTKLDAVSIFHQYQYLMQGRYKGD